MHYCNDALRLQILEKRGGALYIKEREFFARAVVDAWPPTPPRSDPGSGG
jgi:hypothetical protein